MARDTALDPKTLIIPGHGNVLVSTATVAEPFDVEKFVIGDSATYGTGWQSIGYTSKEDAVALNKDGGDATLVDTWEEDGTDATYEAIQWSFTVNSLSMSKSMYDLAFGGGAYDATLKGYGMGDIEPVEKSVMIIFAHNGKRAGLYIRRAKLSVGDAPSIDTEKYFSVQIKGDVLASDSAKFKKIFWFDARPYKAAA